MKNKILGLFNLLFGAFFIYAIFALNPNPSLQDITREVESIPFILAALTNFFISYQLIAKKKLHIPYYIYALLTFIPLVWIGMLFIGFFFASEFIFPIVSIVIAVLLFLYFQKHSKPYAIYVASVTIITVLIVLISSFEEDYCSRKGQEAEKSGPRITKATKEDAARLEGFGVKEGSMIGVAFRTHMLCHDSFIFSD